MGFTLIKSFTFGLLLIFSSHFMTSSPAPVKPVVYYVFDPLCGWCYGFSPVMVKLEEEFKDRADFKIVSGGMVLGPRVGPIGKVAPYISWAYKNVEDATGVKFGEGFLKGVMEPGTMIFNSQMPCVAVTFVKNQKPSSAISFAHHLQKEIYFNGKDMNQPDSYAGLAEHFNLNFEELKSALNDSVWIVRTFEDFEYAQTLGVNGFPTVIYSDASEKTPLARGYTDYETIKARLLHELNSSR